MRRYFNAVLLHKLRSADKLTKHNIEMRLLLLTELLLSFFVKLCAATERQCHNETGRCFWLGTGSKTWDAARTACQSEGGDLAVMETEELDNFVSNLFTARYLGIPFVKFFCSSFQNVPCE